MGAPATPQIIGRYAIHSRIASGGMATVHLGRLLGEGGFSRTVAIKRLHPHLADEPEFLSTMMDEAKLASRIHHPNVVPTLDIVSTGDELLIVMEYVRGESLTRLLRVENAAGRRMPLSIASAVVIGALHGLHAAHEATNDRGEPLGIVHRDVSPQNILVGVDGLARVIDFGVAKAAGRLQTTRDGVVKGKLVYMAPEQVAGHEVTRRVDVYAMGAVFWEMLVGRRRFHADTDAEVYGLVLAGGSDPPSRHAPDIPPALDAFVLKALAVDPSRRFATAKEMAETLLRVVPPAFPTDVGAWVDQTAREALARREALLAEVESGSRSGVCLVSARAGTTRKASCSPKTTSSPSARSPRASRWRHRSGPSSPRARRARGSRACPLRACSSGRWSWRGASRRS
jgi:serine/threonine protein kinase